MPDTHAPVRVTMRYVVTLETADGKRKRVYPLAQLPLPCYRIDGQSWHVTQVTLTPED